MDCKCTASNDFLSHIDHAFIVGICFVHLKIKLITIAIRASFKRNEKVNFYVDYSINICITQKVHLLYHVAYKTKDVLSL